MKERELIAALQRYTQGGNLNDHNSNRVPGPVNRLTAASPSPVRLGSASKSITSGASALMCRSPLPSIDVPVRSIVVAETHAASRANEKSLRANRARCVPGRIIWEPCAGMTRRRENLRRPQAEMVVVQVA